MRTLIAGFAQKVFFILRRGYAARWELRQLFVQSLDRM
jgi:hypothetical protein